MLTAESILAPHRRWLEDGGTIQPSGSHRTGTASLYLHSDYGPPEQDKRPENQDFALAWTCADHGSPSAPQLVVAIADGLTDSFRSDWAAQAACWASVRTIVEGYPTHGPHELALAAINAAGEAIGAIADGFAAAPAQSLPPGQYISTWEYMLRKGKLLQTTLSVAWLDHSCLRVASIGDGGAACRTFGLSPGEDHRDRVLAYCDLDSNATHAIGPAARRGHILDSWTELDASRPLLCAVYTDGLGRARHFSPHALLDELDELHAAGTTNPAEQYIVQALLRRSEAFFDNLTLAVIRTIGNASEC